MRRPIPGRWLSTTLAGMLGSVLGVGVVHAATINNWNVAAGGSWNTGSNWSTTNVPLSTEDAQFGSILPAATNAITLDADQTVYGILVATGSGTKIAQITSGTPSTSKLILLSTDQTADGVSTFFAANAVSGVEQINAPVQLGNASSGTTQETFNRHGVNANSFIFNGDITDSPGSVGAVRISGNGTGIVNYGTTGKTYSGTTTVSSAGILRD